MDSQVGLSDSYRQFPIHNGTFDTFVISKMWKITLFFDKISVKFRQCFKELDIVVNQAFPTVKSGSFEVQVWFLEVATSQIFCTGLTIENCTLSDLLPGQILIVYMEGHWNFTYSPFKVLFYSTGVAGAHQSLVSLVNIRCRNVKCKRGVNVVFIIQVEIHEQENLNSQNSLFNLRYTEELDFIFHMYTQIYEWLFKW